MLSTDLAPAAACAPAQHPQAAYGHRPRSQGRSGEQREREKDARARGGVCGAAAHTVNVHEVGRGSAAVASAAGTGALTAFRRHAQRPAQLHGVAPVLLLHKRLRGRVPRGCHATLLLERGAGRALPRRCCPMQAQPQERTRQTALGERHCSSRWACSALCPAHGMAGFGAAEASGGMAALWEGRDQHDRAQREADMLCGWRRGLRAVRLETASLKADGGSCGGTAANPRNAGSCLPPSANAALQAGQQAGLWQSAASIRDAGDQWQALPAGCLKHEAQRAPKLAMPWPPSRTL